MQWLQCRLLQELCPSLGRFSCDTESKRCDLLVFRVAFLGFWLCWLCQSNLQQIHQPPSVIISCSGSPWHAKCLDPSDYRNAKTTWHDAGAEGPCRERFGKVNVEKPLKIDVSKCFFLKKQHTRSWCQRFVESSPLRAFWWVFEKRSRVFICIHRHRIFVCDVFFDAFLWTCSTPEYNGSLFVHPFDCTYHGAIWPSQSQASAHHSDARGHGHLCINRSAAFKAIIEGSRLVIKKSHDLLFQGVSGHDSPMFWSCLCNVSSKVCPKCSKQDLLLATSAQRSKPCCQSNILIDLDLYSACSAWLK